jgi:hypothetical protein
VATLQPILFPYIVPISPIMWPSVALLDPCRERVSEAHAHELLPRFVKAIARYPHTPPLFYSIGLLCLQFGYIDLWKHYTSIAMSLPHLSHEDLLYRAEAKIRLDDWSGWADREARLLNPRETTVWERYAREIQWTRKAWHGDERIVDKTILVITDGGFGDCLQMLRFIPTLAQFAGKVVVSVHSRCLAIARASIGHAAEVITPDHLPWVAVDRYTWLMSLAALCGSLPAFEPFEVPSPLGGRADGHRRLRVGLCWAGTSHHPSTSDAGRARSITLADLTPLLSRDDLHCYSLQVGYWATDAARYPRLRSPATSLTTFAETATVIAGLDAVITVDTSVAHLAGLLGIPTFLLLYGAGDFRWGMADTTAWYPSMRIVRTADSDWRSVVTRLMTYLDARDLPRSD